MPKGERSVKLFRFPQPQNLSTSKLPHHPHIPHIPRMFSPLHRTSLELLAEGFRGEVGFFVQVGGGEAGARVEGWVAFLGGKAVPGTHLLADIAAKHPITDQGL